ncbi:MAG: hypothetical protein HIU93_12205 [Acidobacteria bacterium]|nr:hypothetical protein [Acidobacteriota bacterium]MBW4046138.1 hypothetical protein [Acidobacteriota bacterium]
MSGFPFFRAKPVKKVSKLKDEGGVPRTGRTRVRRQKRPDAEVYSAEGESEPVDLKDFRSLTEEALRKKFRKILGALAEEAQKGSLKHTEWLLDFAGVDFGELAGGEMQKKMSLAELLLQEIKKDDVDGKA